MSPIVVVVVGAGGIGIAVARRIGSGARLLLSDHDGTRLQAAAASLAADGYDVTCSVADVSDHASVLALADMAGSLGTVGALVHTAGVSWLQAGSAETLYRVNLFGTAWVLDAFERFAAPGMSSVVISSISRLFSRLPPDVVKRMAQAAAADLPAVVHTDLRGDPWNDPETAYAVSKAFVYERMRAVSVAWGPRGARVNSVSPGGIATEMGRLSLDRSETARARLATTPMRRMGTADDVAAAVEFLIGRAAAFITGTDLLVDGGVSAAFRYGTSSTR